MGTKHPGKAAATPLRPLQHLSPHTSAHGQARDPRLPSCSDPGLKLSVVSTAQPHLCHSLQPGPGGPSRPQESLPSLLLSCSSPALIQATRRPGLPSPASPSDPALTGLLLLSLTFEPWGAHLLLPSSLHAPAASPTPPLPALPVVTSCSAERAHAAATHSSCCFPDQHSRAALALFLLWHMSLSRCHGFQRHLHAMPTWQPAPALRPREHAQVWVPAPARPAGARGPWRDRPPWCPLPSLPFPPGASAPQACCPHLSPPQSRGGGLFCPRAAPHTAPEQP